MGKPTRNLIKNLPKAVKSGSISPGVAIGIVVGLILLSVLIAVCRTMADGNYYKIYSYFIKKFSTSICVKGVYSSY